MGDMKKYCCPACKTTAAVIRYGYRKKVLRLFCKACDHHFSYDPVYLPARSMMNDHLDGLSFGKLSAKYGISKTKVYRLVHEELKRLPFNNEFTFTHCNRFSSIFLFDGKYIHVKGYTKKIALLWGIDYFRHDIPVFSLAPSENYQSWGRFFSYFRIICHFPTYFCCDDNQPLKAAARHAFPQVKIQTCANHLKENVRRLLNTRTDPLYAPVISRLADVIGVKRSSKDFTKRMFALFHDYRSDSRVLSILTDIERSHHELLAYRNIKNAPITTNLMECYNSHLESRLFSLKGFESYRHAKLWLNGYILKRRYAKLTGCTGYFRRLNGCKPVEKTKKLGSVLPILF